MRQRPHVVIVFVIAVVVGAGVAGAQTRPPAPPPRRPPPTDRIFISVDGLFQNGSDDFSNTVAFRRNAEDSSFSTNYDVKSGPAFNISGAGWCGARLQSGWA